MPLYEYVCANGHRTEVMHGVHAEGPTACPKCGATMRKAFVAPTIHFKGSGWAKVDRRSSTNKRSAGDTAAREGSGSEGSGSEGSASEAGATKPAGDAASTDSAADPKPAKEGSAKPASE